MKKGVFYSVVACLFVIYSCTSYQDKQYGPVSFSTEFEQGDDFLIGNAEAIAVIDFKPEEFGFSKESVGGMRLSSINLSLDEEADFGIFESIKIEVSSDETEMLTIGVLNDVPAENTIVIEGLEKAKIKKFNKVDEFYLHISGNLKDNYESSLGIFGEFTLLVESADE